MVADATIANYQRIASWLAHGQAELAYQRLVEAIEKLQTVRLSPDREATRGSN